MNISGPDPKGSYAEILTGTRAILDRLPALRADAGRWGQLAELEELPYLLSVPIAPRREPLLVLLHTFSKKGAAEAGTLMGGVLVFAYSAGLFGRRLIAHPDRTGRRCVFGPPADRSGIAISAARFLLKRGAVLTVIPYRAGDDRLDISRDVDLDRELDGTLRVQNALCTLGMMGTNPSVEWALHGARPPAGAAARLHARRHPYPGSVDAPAATCALPHATSSASSAANWSGIPRSRKEEMERFNARSTYRVRQGVVCWRYGVWKQDPEAFLAGLRGANGEWLALAGGRRTRDGVTLDWQMNKRFPRFSVSLVMRGLLMDRFGKEGLSRMRFEGGTTHALVRGFRRGARFTRSASGKGLSG